MESKSGNLKNRFLDFLQYTLNIISVKIVILEEVNGGRFG